MEREATDGGHHLGAVDQRERLLRPEHDGLQARALQRIGATHPLVLEHRVALADQHEGGMGERCQVAGRSHAPVHRDDRMHAAIQKIEEQVDRLGPDARSPGCEGVRAQEQDRAGDVPRERVADAGRMAAQEVELQPGEIASFDPHLREIAEPGVHAVDRLVTVGELGDDLRGGADPLLGAAIEGDRDVATRDVDDVRDREALAVDAERRHYRSLCSGVRWSRYQAPSST